MQIGPVTILKAVGVVLFTVVFVRLFSMPWGLVAGAALAMVVLP